MFIKYRNGFRLNTRYDKGECSICHSKYKAQELVYYKGTRVYNGCCTDCAETVKYIMKKYNKSQQLAIKDLREYLRDNEFSLYTTEEYFDYLYRGIDKKYIFVGSAAKILGISGNYLAACLFEKRIRAYQINERYIFSESDMRKLSIYFDKDESEVVRKFNEIIEKKHKEDCRL